MLRRFVWVLVAFPVAIVLLTLAVINRHGVRLVLDPFRPDEPVLFAGPALLRLSLRHAADRHRHRRRWPRG